MLLVILNFSTVLNVGRGGSSQFKASLGRMCIQMLSLMDLWWYSDWLHRCDKTPYLSFDQELKNHSRFFTLFMHLLICYRTIIVFILLSLASLKSLSMFLEACIQYVQIHLPSLRYFLIGVTFASLLIYVASQVNPIAVNSKYCNVFTENKRTVVIISTKEFGKVRYLI